MSPFKSTLAVAGLLLVALFFGAHDLIATPPPPTLPGMPDQAPIDGGLGLLAAAGGAYAFKKLKAGSKKRNAEDDGRGTNEEGR